MEASLSRKLAVWASGLKFENLPLEVVRHAKRQLLDTVGVRIAAHNSELGIRARRLLGQEGGIGTGPAFEAFVGGILTTCLDFDDTHHETLIHPSSAIVPALLSTTRRHPPTGPEFLTALVAGYEVACRIGVAAPGQFHKRGFHPTGVVGALGAAAACAKAKRFDAKRTEDTLGFAASMAGGLLQAIIDGTDARHVNPGSAALNGVVASSLALEDFAAAGQPLDGKFGLLPAHIQGGADLDFPRVTDGLGDIWETLNIKPKPYPTGYVTHEFIDGILSLCANEKLTADDIVSIVCELPHSAAQLVFIPLDQKVSPQRATAARVALPHILAEAIVFGNIDADSFNADRLNNPEVRHLAKRVTYHLVEDATESRLTVTLRNGAQRTRAIVRREMSESDVVSKFFANVTPHHPGIEAETLAEAIFDLENERSYLTYRTKENTILGGQIS